MLAECVPDSPPVPKAGCFDSERKRFAASKQAFVMLKSILLELSTTQMNFEGRMCSMSTNPMIEQTLFGSFLGEY